MREHRGSRLVEGVGAGAVPSMLRRSIDDAKGRDLMPSAGTFPLE